MITRPRRFGKTLNMTMLRELLDITKDGRGLFTALNCCCFARVDMFLTPAGEIYFNEVNTIPGFTEHSRYPNMLKEAGLPFDEVIGRLIEMGVSK